MRRLKQMRTLIVILFVVATSMTAHAQKVQVGSDPAVDVSKYKTYKWASGTAVPNPIVSKMIVDTVDEALAAKGLRKVETDPELTVAAVGVIETGMNMDLPSWSPGQNAIKTPGSSQPVAVSRGTLVVEISDTKTKNSVWRGSSSQTLERGPTGDQTKDAKTVAKPIKKAVEKMFKQYPHPDRK